MQTRRLLSLVGGVALSALTACSGAEESREAETGASQVQTTPVDSAVRGIDVPASGPLDSLPDPQGRGADSTTPGQAPR